jgi:hypothetical protein
VRSWRVLIITGLVTVVVGSVSPAQADERASARTTTSFGNLAPPTGPSRHGPLPQSCATAPSSRTSALVAGSGPPHTPDYNRRPDGLVAGCVWDNYNKPAYSGRWARADLEWWDAGSSRPSASVIRTWPNDLYARCGRLGGLGTPRALYCRILDLDGPDPTRTKAIRVGAGLGRRYVTLVVSVIDGRPNMDEVVAHFRAVWRASTK